MPEQKVGRIISANEEVRYVLSVGRGVLGPHGRVESVTGYFVDLTGVRERQARSRTRLDELLGRLGS